MNLKSKIIMRDNPAQFSNQIEHDKAQLNKELTHTSLLFFTGLIFTSLSLSLQFNIDTENVCLKVLELVSWGLLLSAGCSGLILSRLFATRIDIGRNCEFLRKITHFCLNIFGKEKTMWISFIVAMILQMVCRAFVSFAS